MSLMKIQTAFLTLGRELRSALRTARKDPIVSAMVVLSLAAAVGMNTLVYCAVDTLLLRPLSYPDADRLAVVWAGDTREPDRRSGVAPPDFLDWRAQAHAFVGLAAAAGTLVNLSGPPNPERVQAARVSASFFPDVLQVQPLLGRFFMPVEDEEAASVAILSHGLWQRQFGGEQSVVGQVCA